MLECGCCWGSKVQSKEAEITKWFWILVPWVHNLCHLTISETSSIPSKLFSSTATVRNSLSLSSLHFNNISAETEPRHVARSHWSGVIWKGDELIDGVPQTLDMLRAKGKKLVFVTNNSWKSRSQYADKFRSLGISVSQVRFWFEDLDVVLWIVVVIFFFLFFFARMRYSPRLLRLLCTWRSTISLHSVFLSCFLISSSICLRRGVLTKHSF